MKALDEVIKSIEIYKNIFDKNGCFECHYHEDDCTNSCFLENVLYYLNTIETTENLYHNAVNELNKWIDEDWKDRCLPLTWDELQQMEGKPVWVEQCNSDIKGWLLILRTNFDVINCTTRHGNSFYLYKSSYGERWQAYKKENNGR